MGKLYLYRSSCYRLVNKKKIYESIILESFATKKQIIMSMFLIILAKAVEWVLKHQTEDGSFYETTWIPDRKYNSSLNFNKNDPIAQRNITLTAHVLITLESVKDLTSKHSMKLNSFNE